LSARAIGGTHLVGRSPDYLDKTIVELEKFDLKLISPCHCSGFVGMARLWNAFPSAFVLNFSGRTIEAGKEPKPVSSENAMTQASPVFTTGLKT